jgi:hypothetical protein
MYSTYLDEPERVTHMIATAHEETVRLRADKTVRLRPADFAAHAFAPHGEERMFPLNTATVIITLVGHLVFGLVLGFAFLKAPRGKDRSQWPWPPVFDSAPAKRIVRFAKKLTNSP